MGGLQNLHFLRGFYGLKKHQNIFSGGPSLGAGGPNLGGRLSPGSPPCY